MSLTIIQYSLVIGIYSIKFVMTYLLEYLDENGVLHMCVKCRFIYVKGNPKNKIMVARFYNNPPKNTNFVVCTKCSVSLPKLLHKRSIPYIETNTNFRHVTQ